MKVLKVPAMLFATLHESGTPVKKHLESMAFLGRPDDVGSLGDETYVTIWESPPEGECEPCVIHHTEEPPTGGAPIHPEVEPPTGGVSTAQVSIGPAVEPQTGGIQLLSMILCSRGVFLGFLRFVVCLYGSTCSM